MNNDQTVFEGFAHSGNGHVGVKIVKQGNNHVLATEVDHYGLRVQSQLTLTDDVRKLLLTALLHNTPQHIEGFDYLMDGRGIQVQFGNPGDIPPVQPGTRGSTNQSSGQLTQVAQSVFANSMPSVTAEGAKADLRKVLETTFTTRKKLLEENSGLPCILVVMPVADDNRLMRIMHEVGFVPVGDDGSNVFAYIKYQGAFELSGALYPVCVVACDEDLPALRARGVTALAVIYDFALALHPNWCHSDKKDEVYKQVNRCLSYASNYRQDPFVNFAVSVNIGGLEAPAASVPRDCGDRSAIRGTISAEESTEDAVELGTGDGEEPEPTARAKMEFLLSKRQKVIDKTLSPRGVIPRLAVHVLTSSLDQQHAVDLAAAVGLSLGAQQGKNTFRLKEDDPRYADIYVVIDPYFCDVLREPNLDRNILAVIVDSKVEESPSWNAEPGSPRAAYHRAMVPAMHVLGTHYTQHEVVVPAD